MRRILAAPFLLLPLSLHAQKPSETTLPVTHVSLYKNGVGYFELSGHVSGNASVTIPFTNSQLNDVLQSLTAIDLNGGRISGAGYNSATPLEQQLKTLSLNLDSNPSAADFYAAIRGARVAVTSGGASITGRLLSVEVRSIPTKDDAKTADKYFLTIASDEGTVRTFELTGTTSVRLLDTALHTDVTRYLQLLDANRSQGLRHLTLTDNGIGSRELHVSYISEVPVWKSTYRILTTDNNTTATMQGWSVVDNTTGTDWINVHLSLIAGAPQSFIQPLSQPIYTRRPEIPIAQEAQLTPQTFDSNIDDKSGTAGVTVDGIEPMARAKMPAGPTRPHGSVVGMAGMAGGGSGGVMMSASGGYGSGSGIGAGSGGYLSAPPPPPPTYEESASTSITPNTQAKGFDDFFAYNLSEPITIRKNESALVPILQTKLPVESVTLLSYRNGYTSQPLRALWLTNTSGLTLDRGSFTIIESGNFAGEGLLDPIHPDEKRLLSYAADQAVHATVEGDKSANHITFLRGSRGVLNIHHADQHEVTLVLHNAAPAARTIISEIPVVPGWKLDSEAGSSDPKPVETTPTVYRFRTELAPGETKRVHIGANRPSYSTYYLTRADDNQLQFILSTTNHDPALESALQPILDARRRMADAQTAVDTTNAKLNALRTDEDRQRANITALANADKSSRERFVRDLNKTEDEIAATQATLKQQQSTLDTAKADLAAKIEAFSINTKA
ncbi:DUF4139 domain-containing protein [Granulicella cerasi]|uniref:DUF4139 domain-containing protein n=1 Tax=Granulicella cerasi TaxID=741063 RepID=A0ABW1Z5B3_9BACT|nr:DUF4139 domain-containing protein [Granulicella cerasi]